VKSRILLGLAVMFVLMITLSQPVLAYTYPDSNNNKTKTWDSTSWIILAVPLGIALVIAVVALFNRHYKNKSRGNMTSSSEKVLWGLRLPFRLDPPLGGYEMLFTSERILGQDLSGGEKTYRAVSGLIFLGPIGAILRPNSDAFRPPRFNIDPKRISGSIQYSEISKLTVDVNSDFMWNFFKGSEAKPMLSIRLGKENHKAALSAISPLLGDRISPL